MAERRPSPWWPQDIGAGASRPAQPLGSQQWEVVEEPLSLEKLYDLVRIAHETTDPQVKEAAIATLMRALHPAMRFVE